jgi:predicted permease
MTAILQDIGAILFVLALGYFAGRREVFTQDQAAGFNKLVLDFCLPAVLFVSIVKSTRDELLSDGTLLYLSLGVLVGWYAAAFLVARLVFRRNSREAGIAGLSAAAPTVGFLGMAVLSPLYGGAAALSVAIMALVVNVVQVPLGMFFVASTGTKPGAAVLTAMKEPVVLAPLIAVALVLAGIRVPELLLPPFALIGHANSGLAVFAAGVVLSVHKAEFSREVFWNAGVKMVLIPATMLAAALACGITGDKLQQIVLLSALPPAFTGVVVAGRFQTYVSPASSTLIVGALTFAAAAPFWIAVARYFGG